MANITFVEVEETDTEVGDIRFAISGDPGTSYAWNPGNSSYHGDVWIGTNTAARDLSEGTYAFATLMHEIGHAIGLTHPHDSTPVADSTLTAAGFEAAFGLCWISHERGSVGSGLTDNNICRCFGQAWAGGIWDEGSGA